MKIYPFFYPKVFFLARTIAFLNIDYKWSVYFHPYKKSHHAYEDVKHHIIVKLLMPSFIQPLP